MGSKARQLYGLHASLAAAGLMAAIAAVVAALSVTTFALPSASRLLASCGAWLALLGSLEHLAVALFYGLGLVALYRGGRAAWRTGRSTRRFISGLRVVAELAGELGASVFENPTPQAFCAGLRRPRIYVSTGVLGRLGAEELDAVLAHEAEHMRRRDPLRLWATRVAAEACFFLPAVRTLGRRCEALAELAADEAAIERPGGRRALASALLALGEHSRNGVSVGADGERVGHLLGDAPRVRLPAASLTAASVLVVTLSGLIFAFAHDAGGSSVPFASLAMQACDPVMLAAAGLVVLRTLRRAATGSRSAPPRAA